MSAAELALRLEDARGDTNVSNQRVKFLPEYDIRGRAEVRAPVLMLDPVSARPHTILLEAAIADCLEVPLLFRKYSTAIATHRHHHLSARLGREDTKPTQIL